MMVYTILMKQSYLNLDEDGLVGDLSGAYGRIVDCGDVNGWVTWCDRDTELVDQLLMDKVNSSS